jgi:hypothetical protein
LIVATFFGLLLSNSSGYVLILSKMGCATFWDIFFTNSSGRPAADQPGGDERAELQEEDEEEHGQAWQVPDAAHHLHGNPGPLLLSKKGG